MHIAGCVPTSVPPWMQYARGGKQYGIFVHVRGFQRVDDDDDDDDDDGGDDDGDNDNEDDGAFRLLGMTWYAHQ
eukprot:COSAG05_NODE_1465_length_4804_cov_372.506270_2_plen_74_part_00